MANVRLPLLAAGAAAWVLAACGGTSDPAPVPSPTETTVQPTTPPASPPARGAVAHAVVDLAGSLGVEETDVEVVATEEVTWRNGSRGCAQPGMMYTDALIEGSRITLRVAGTSYEYHSGGSQPPARCDRPTE